MVDLPKNLREMADHLWDVEHRINVDDDAKTLTEAADLIERLNEKVEILEAEIRVMRKLPAAVSAAMNASRAARQPEGGEA